MRLLRFSFYIAIAAIPMTLPAPVSLPSHLIRLHASDGAQIAVSLHGGHLCSWRSADGIERLFLSRRSAWQDGVAIRGGMPVIFPQFANQGPMTKHGFARDLPWTLLASEVDATGAGVMRLGLTDSAQTSALAGQFSLELVLRFSGSQLISTLQVTNTGTTGFSFTAALHTYLQTPVASTRIGGLHGHRYRDSIDQARSKIEMQAALQITQEIDRIYTQVTAPVTLTSDTGRLDIGQTGFEDVVVWNPWIDKAASLSDMQPSEYQEFVCIEAALIEQPCTLAPGQTWQGQQTLLASTTPFTPVQETTP
ncbi:D-hexose-6-phosphate mutarotase [Actimicrobium antarcticum]|uniref:Putative glucose-6-phosphate 1-epimerase n=2 Tax=Actimicrobium antarcticum TaxID=1051899 RepID=A0ABP7TVF7_9BURK